MSLALLERPSAVSLVRAPAASDLPPRLRSAGSEGLRLPSGRSVVLPKARLELPLWRGEPVYSFRRKPVLDVDGEPLYAELAIQRLFQRAGWRGVWVNAYRREFRTGLPNRTAPVEFTQGPAAALVQRMIKERGSFAGCPDVAADRKGAVVLVEAMRLGEGSTRLAPERLEWITAALDHDVPATCFLVVEWSIAAD
jgi:hypothetical protein